METRTRHRMQTSKSSVMVGCLPLVASMIIVALFPSPARTADSAVDQSSDVPVVSNVFLETDLREALLNISDQTGVPIIPDRTVHGLITMSIDRLPLDQCLDRILSPLGYSYKNVGDYYLVGDLSPENPSFAMLSTVETIVPSYLKVADVMKLISDFYKPYVKADPRSNYLTIAASPAIVARFRADLAVIDVPPDQIEIDVLVTEVSREKLKEVGFDWILDGSRDGRTGVLQAITDQASDTSAYATGVRTGDASGSWALDYQVTLKALAKDGHADIRANPRLATEVGQPAKIFIGKEEYHAIATGQEPYYVTTRLEVIKVGISLEITPYLSPNGDITIEVKSVVSDVTGQGATGLPVVNTRDVSTRIHVREGESAAIAGLQTEDSRKTVKKVPLLGDIPVLGYLFRSTVTETNKSEIIILITPRLFEG